MLKGFFGVTIYLRFKSLQLFKINRRFETKYSGIPQTVPFFQELFSGIQVRCRPKGCHVVALALDIAIAGLLPSGLNTKRNQKILLRKLNSRLQTSLIFSPLFDQMT